MPEFPTTSSLHSRFRVARGGVVYLAQWLLLSALVGGAAGTASAVLLWSLDLATRVRESHGWLIALLPLAGLAVGLLYHWLGRRVERGSNQILDEIHGPQEVLPLRMTPLILLGTFLTHLFGGSAGREGTALQTGASLADQIARPFGVGSRSRRTLLMAGLSAGFGSVFGTPLAGAVFGLEVLAPGAVEYEAILPCFLAAFFGDFTTRAWGIHHTLYRVPAVPPLSLAGLALAAVAGIVFGLVARCFSASSHAVSALARRYIAWPPLRPLAGGVVVAAAVFLLGSTRYIGLGIPVIQAAFAGPQPPYDFALKLVFTVATIGAGFKGGEVTPLFFIGATLGNALAYLLPLPGALLTGMGFVAVFAGAANTPVASTLMAMELFGSETGGYAALACVLSFLCSGHAGIYRSQRVRLRKMKA